MPFAGTTYNQVFYPSIAGSLVVAIGAVNSRLQQDAHDNRDMNHTFCRQVMANT